MILKDSNAIANASYKTTTFHMAGSLLLSDTTNGLEESRELDLCDLSPLAPSPLTYIRARVVMLTFHTTFKNVSNLPTLRKSSLSFFLLSI